MKILKHRIYNPITNENIEKVFSDISKNRETYIDLVAVPTHDMLILAYYEHDRTMPTEEDVAMYSNQPVQNSKGNLDSIKELILEHKIFVMIGVAAVIAYFYLRGG